MKIVWLREARDDLVAIRRYIGRDNPSAARHVGTKIMSSAGRLAERPQIGRPGRWAGTRELVVPGTPYLLPYRVRAGTVEILRVLHSAQEWPEPPKTHE